MAKLICKDGTEVKISDETEANLRKQFEKKKTFKKIQFCHLGIDVPESRRRVHLSWKDSGITCTESVANIRHTIQCLQSAIDYIEDK